MADDGLVAFLRERYDEEAQMVDGVNAETIWACTDGCVEVDPTERWADGSARLPNHHNVWYDVYDRAQKRVEVDAKRRILDELAVFDPADRGYAQVETVISLLALPYAGHEDYQTEWRP